MGSPFLMCEIISIKKSNIWNYDNYVCTNHSFSVGSFEIGKTCNHVHTKLSKLLSMGVLES